MASAAFDAVAISYLYTLYIFYRKEQMLKYLIAVVEGLLLYSTVIGLLFAAAKQQNRKKQTISVLTGVFAGIGFAIVIVCLTQFTTIIKRGYWNIWFMIIGIGAAVIYSVCLWISAGKKKGRIHGAVWSVAGGVLAGDMIAYSLPAVLMYPGEFVLADESVFSTEFLLKLIGYLLGFLIVILTAVAVYRVVRVLSAGWIRSLFTAVLALFCVTASGVLIQSMFNRWIKVSSGLFGYSSFVVNNYNGFLTGVLLISLIFPIALIAVSGGKNEEYSNPAQRRRIRAAGKGKRRWAVFLIVLFGIGIFTLTGLKSYNEREVTLSPAEPFELAGEEIHIPAQQIEDGHLHRFAYKASDNTEVRFIVIKKNEASYGVGLDACDICGETGYYERDGQVVCKLCDVVMNKSTIGFKGGCNPIPLAYTMANGQMVIKTGDLEAEKSRFSK